MTTRSTAATIHVRFVTQGWHQWPGAPEHRRYLANEHRHLFSVEVSTWVNHDDREIEFHDLRDDSMAAFRANYKHGESLGDRSCEMIARTMGRTLAHKHRGRVFTVSVWEDGECGASVCSEVERP